MAAVVSACYCLLWVGIALGVCMLTRRAATGAGALLGAWLVVVVLMPYAIDWVARTTYPVEPYAVVENAFRSVHPRAPAWMMEPSHRRS